MSDTNTSFFTILPDTPSVKAALTFISDHLDKPTYNHVVRSAVFACLLARNLSKDSANTHLIPVDTEIITISTLLHDMAWNPTVAATRQFISADKRFEVDGANAARTFLQSLPEDHGWDKRRIQLVWDAIALHSTLSISLHKEPEVVLNECGILIDVLGTVEMPLPGVPASSMLTRQDFDEVYKEFPSLQLAAYLKDAMCALCKEKPQTTYDNFVGDYGDEYVEGFTLKGNRIVDMMVAREEAEKTA